MLCWGCWIGVLGELCTDGLRQCVCSSLLWYTFMLYVVVLSSICCCDTYFCYAMHSHHPLECESFASRAKTSWNAAIQVA